MVVPTSVGNWNCSSTRFDNSMCKKHGLLLRLLNYAWLEKVSSFELLSRLYDRVYNFRQSFLSTLHHVHG